MARKLLWLVFAFATAAHAAVDASALNPPELKPVQQEAEAARLAVGLMARYHYKGVHFDDAFSSKIFDEYVKSLDSQKVFFLQSDLDHLSGERSRLVDAILKQDLSVPFAIFNLYERRASERFAYARELLKNGFDFQQAESYEWDRQKEPWPKSEAEMRDLWRKRVKNDWLRLKLAGKDDKAIAGVLDKRYETALKSLSRLKSADAFQSYMNAYTAAIDPHTSYMGPRAAADFDISMRLSLAGIGAALEQLDEYPTIRELIPGGPAILSGALSVGDRIVGVGQGESGPVADVLGWRLDDVVAVIRGAPGSVVRLDIMPAEAGADGRHKLVSLTRKAITLEEQAAKSSVHTVTQGGATRRVGVISLPSFYEDFAARQKGVSDYRSATRDVARLLEDLKKQKVDSVLVDLRNNGGGSLQEAIDLTGLFIDKGPVVQERKAGGEIQIERDTHAGAAWDGPLGVLINRASASASEIFAAAIQDYGRGLIIGEPSFGKGTVQNVVDLDEIAKNSTPKFGELRMTIAQFFRINGDTTQLRGVTPDIAFPAVFDDDSFGESSLDNALPSMHIKPADYSPVGDLKALVPALVLRHEARVKNDPEFQRLQEDITESRLERHRNAISLNEAQRRKEQQAREARLASRDAALQDDGLQPDERTLASELAAEKARKNAKDVLLDEAVNVLGDELGVLSSDAALAARANQRPASMPD